MLFYCTKFLICFYLFYVFCFCVHVLSSSVVYFNVVHVHVHKCSFFYILATFVEQVLGIKIIDTTEKLVDNVHVSNSSAIVKVRGIRIKSSASKKKSKSQQHIADVEHEGCYIFIYYFYIMLTYFILLFDHLLLLSNILFYMYF